MWAGMETYPNAGLICLTRAFSFDPASPDMHEELGDSAVDFDFPAMMVEFALLVKQATIRIHAEMLSTFSPQKT